jgi:hypothetical protein
MIKPIVDFIIAHNLSTYMFEYLFVLKYERQPTVSEKAIFEETYDDIMEEESYEDSYEESLSYDDED